MIFGNLQFLLSVRSLTLWSLTLCLGSLRVNILFELCFSRGGTVPDFKGTRVKFILRWLGLGMIFMTCVIYGLLLVFWSGVVSDKAKKHYPGAAALLCALKARVIAF